jgi:hypothetical protein
MRVDESLDRPMAEEYAKAPADVVWRANPATNAKRAVGRTDLRSGHN